jgi:hypothetical protein
MHAMVQTMANVQIRNVSDEAHRRLKAEAAAAGQSLSEYLKAHVEEMARRPTHAELTERLRARGPYTGPSITEIVREERDKR